MEGSEIDPEKMLEVLPDILAAFLAGDCNVAVVVQFHVGIPWDEPEAPLKSDDGQTLVAGGAVPEGLTASVAD